MVEPAGAFHALSRPLCCHHAETRHSQTDNASNMLEFSIPKGHGQNGARHCCNRGSKGPNFENYSQGPKWGVVGGGSAASAKFGDNTPRRPQCHRPLMVVCTACLIRHLISSCRPLSSTTTSSPVPAAAISIIGAAGDVTSQRSCGEESHDCRSTCS